MRRLHTLGLEFVAICLWFAFCIWGLPLAALVLG